jgi:hypothetical protein
MKIALVDNMNNNFFSIARYLRDAGIDTHLYLMPNTINHFKPENDTFEDIANIDWIHQFPMKNTFEYYIGGNKNKTNTCFKDFDIVIACGYSLSFLKKADIDVDIFIPYGSDLRTAPFFKSAKEQYFTNPIKRWPKMFVKRFFMKKIKYFHMKAIKEAKVILAYAPIKIMQDPLRKLEVNYINEQMPMLYNKENIHEVSKEQYIAKSNNDKLNNSKFVVFNHSRQAWATNSNKLEDFDQYLGIKRNDRVIKAFGKFVENTKLKNPLLVLFEYGPDVKQSKQLIKELCIENNTIWFPIMPRKVILMLLKKYASFGTDQYRENISDGLSGTAFEVLASGVPLMGYHAHQDLPENKWYLESPIIDVLTDNDICEIFKDYESNPIKYKDIGQKSKIWFEKNLGQGLADKYIKMINLMVEDKSLTHNNEIIRNIFEK